MASRPGPDELRVLIATLFPRDAELTAECLDREGIACVPCADDDELFDELECGAGVVVIARERLSPEMLARFRPYLERRPAWSDLPLIVLVPDSKRSGMDATSEIALDLLDPMANVTVIERPAHQRGVVSAVRAALRARRRQYESRALLLRLAETDRRKDAFIAMLGHELRNPLAAIQGASSLLESVPEKSARLTRVSDVIGRQIGNLQRLVDDLLDVARIQAGKITLKRQRIGVLPAVEQVFGLLEPLARAHAHTVELVAPEEEVLVDADPVRLEQMVGNLLHNAIKYTPDGGRIEVRVGCEVGRVRIAVRDTGRGLAPESVHQIFEHFTQVDSSIDRSMGGLGLGLPLVRGLASLHGGAVRAASEGLGKGSEFTITLPLAPAGAVASTGVDTTTSELVTLQRGLRVLLVDDILDVLDVLRLGLEARGCQVDTAHNGAYAVERARGGGYDIAFMDIGLPVMDGLTAARAIRSDTRSARLPLVAMSGYGREEDKHRSAAAGFDRHLVKPVDAAQLLRTAAEILGASARP